MPGMIAANRYSPPSLVMTIRVTPVDALLRVTVAPAITAPLWSLTTPTIEPVSICALRTEGRRKRNARHRSLTVRSTNPNDLLIFTPPQKNSKLRNPPNRANVIMNVFRCKHVCDASDSPLLRSSRLASRSCVQRTTYRSPLYFVAVSVKFPSNQLLLAPVSWEINLLASGKEHVGGPSRSSRS